MHISNGLSFPFSGTSILKPHTKRRLDRILETFSTMILIFVFGPKSWNKLPELLCKFLVTFYCWFQIRAEFSKKNDSKTYFFLLVKNHVKSLPKKKQINFGVIFFGRLMPKNKTKKIRQKLMDYAWAIGVKSTFLHSSCIQNQISFFLFYIEMNSEGY